MVYYFEKRCFVAADLRWNEGGALTYKGKVAPRRAVILFHSNFQKRNHHE